VRRFWTPGEGPAAIYLYVARFRPASPVLQCGEGRVSVAENYLQKVSGGPVAARQGLDMASGALYSNVHE